MLIRLAITPSEIEACFPVMAELRPHLDKCRFVEIVQHLRATTGFQLAFLEDDGVHCVAGFRVSEWLAGGRYMEIEDLVASTQSRSKGYGGKMFDWLVEQARIASCDHLRLVSRLDRADAHRFYERMGMAKLAYYFSMDLRM